MSVYAAKKKRLQRIEREKAESIKYYNEHKEEIELKRKAALISWKISRLTPIKLKTEDIFNKATPAEIKYYARWCMPL